MRNRGLILACAWLCASLLAAACSGNPTPTPTPPPTDTPEPPTPTPTATATGTPSPTPTATGTTAPAASETPGGGGGATGGGGEGGPHAAVEIPAAAQPLVLAAADDLAKRVGADVSQLTVREVTPMDWGDTSLGCPQPDQFYAQVITPGYLIVLESAGQTFNYHTDLVGNFILCDK